MTAYLRRFLPLDRRWMLWLIGPIASVAALADLVLLVAIARALVSLSTSETGSLPVVGDVELRDLLVVAASAIVIGVAVRSAESAVIGRMSSDATVESRNRAIRAYLEAPWGYVASLRSGALTQLVGPLSQPVSMLPVIFSSLAVATVGVVAYLGAVVVIAPEVALLFAVIGSTIGVVFAFIRQVLRRSAQSAMDAANSIQLDASSISGLLKDIKLFGVSAEAADFMSREAERARRPLYRLRGLQNLLPVLFQQILLLGVVLTISFASSADLDLESFGAAALLSLRALSYLQQLNSLSQRYAETEPYLQELSSAIDSLEAASEGVLCGAEDMSISAVSVDSASFTYDGTSRVLHDVSFRMNAGDWVGIVGPSGGGKTTLAALVAGLHRPTSGTVLLSGQHAHDVVAAGTGKIAMLSQEPALLRGTLRENIEFFRTKGIMPVAEAAEAAGILIEVEQLADGFDSRVEDGGQGLSGGQRQRIALARAIASSPDLLILDEPTSALDLRSTKAVEDAIWRSFQTSMVIVVSHRPELLRKCNRLLVIRDGRVEYDGANSEAAWAKYAGSIEGMV